jgi:glycosyltransferase involved in cell wall biosynthesis
MKQIRIAVICPIADDPTSFYRGVGPLSNLQKHVPQISLIFPQPVTWASLALADIVYLQRPCAPEHFQILAMAKDLGLPVWCDFDDDNLSVPKDNPTYMQYNQMHVKEAIVKLARHCDVLTVATEKLRKKYTIYNKNTILVPNGIDDRLLIHRQIQKTPRQKMILWRGTPTHKRNLDILKDSIIRLANKYPDWKMGFLGFDPIDITDHIKNYVLMGANGPIETYKALIQIHAYAGYYVLAPNDHAQARSHISWLEYTFAGMPTVAIKNEEFTRPGLLNFETPKDYEELVEKLMLKEIDPEPLVEQSWNHIQENYMLSKINKTRAEIIANLIGASLSS